MQFEGIQAKPDARLIGVCALFKDRCDTLVVLADWAKAYYSPALASDEDMAKHVTQDIKPALASLADKLDVSEWSKDAIAAAIKATLAEHGLKMPQLAMPVRVLMLGTTNTPSVDAMLALFDKKNVVTKLKEA